MSALPDTKIVILTTFDTEEYVFEGIRAGAVGYLLKDTLPEELIDAIRAAPEAKRFSAQSRPLKSSVRHSAQSNSLILKN